MSNSRGISIFMCGDVMTGRGIDQILPYPSIPVIYEPFMKSALGYVHLAEELNGPIKRPVGFSYIWGDALNELKLASPDARIINLETAVTKSDDYWKGKEINYRMNPKNIPCITSAGIDCCSLANNHVLDWGYAGLTETLETLKSANVKCAGAGLNAKEAGTPVIIDLGRKGRVVFFSYGSETSGIALNWAALEKRSGVNLIEDFSDAAVSRIKKEVREVKKKGDAVIASLHWGGNWGYKVPKEQREFAHALVAEAGIDIIHGHSSHHAKGIEVHEGHLIIYGCGDFINDYEGIGGYEHYRGDLGLMYFAEVDPESGNLTGLRMTPTQMKNFRVNRASHEDAEWLTAVLNREGKQFGAKVEMDADNRLELRWD
ncbi:MAG: CapA family protein [Nitrospirota bacterium]